MRTRTVYNLEKDKNVATNNAYNPDSGTVRRFRQRGNEPSRIPLWGDHLRLDWADPDL